MIKTTIKFIKRLITPQNVVLLIGITLVVIYIPFFMKTPLTSASDVLHHTWIANAISENGTIPINNPITDGFDILSLSPLFQILGAQLNQLTGVDTILIFIGLNFLLPLLFIMGIYTITKSIFNAKIAMLASLLFLFFNTYTYLSRHITFLEIKQATIAIFLMLVCFRIVLTFFEDNQLIARKLLPLFLLLTGIQLTHQFTSFAVFTLLGSLSILLIIFYPTKRKKSFILLLLLLLSLLTVLLLNVNLLFSSSGGYLRESENTITKSYTETSTITANGVDKSILAQTFNNAYPSIMTILALVGILFIIFKKRKRGLSLPVNQVFLLVWIGTFIVLSLQRIGNFQLLPTRFLYWSTIPVSILASFSVYRITKLLPQAQKSVAIITSTLIIIVISTIVFNSNSYYSNENISFNEIKSFNNIREFLSTQKDADTVFADPFLGYKLITLSNAKLSYSYSRTGMKRDDSLELEAVKEVFNSDAQSVYQYLNDRSIKYVFINFDDMTRYYKNTNYSMFSDTIKYKKIFVEYAGTEDEIIGYEVVQ